MVENVHRCGTLVRVDFQHPLDQIQKTGICQRFPDVVETMKGVSWSFHNSGICLTLTLVCGLQCPVWDTAGDRIKNVGCLSPTVAIWWLPKSVSDAPQHVAAV